MPLQRIPGLWITDAPYRCSAYALPLQRIRFTVAAHTEVASKKVTKTNDDNDLQTSQKCA